MSTVPIYWGNHDDELLLEPSISTFTSAGYANANRSVFSTEGSQLRHIKVRGRRDKPTKGFLSSAWPIIAFIVSFLTAASLCVKFFGRRMGAEAHIRRLAEQGRNDDRKSPWNDSSDFAAFCDSIGARNLGILSSVAASASPLRIEGVPDEEEGDDTRKDAESEATSASGTPQVPEKSQECISNLKRQASGVACDEEQGSRPKVARTESLVTGAQFVDDKPSTSSEVTGSVPFQPQSGIAGQKHPFVRLPALLPNVSPRLLEPIVVRNRPVFSIDSPLAAIRELLLKTALCEEDANDLVSHAELLAGHAYHYMNQPVSHKEHYYSVRPMGRRFMVLNALHAVGQVTGASLQLEKWWDDFAKRIPDMYERFERIPKSGVVTQTHQLLRDLSDAIRLYKERKSPSEEKVLSIKLRLFSKGGRKREFTKPFWAPWRQDAEWEDGDRR